MYYCLMTAMVLNIAEVKSLCIQAQLGLNFFFWKSLNFSTSWSFGLSLQAIFTYRPVLIRYWSFGEIKLVLLEQYSYSRYFQIYYIHGILIIYTHPKWALIHFDCIVVRKKIYKEGVLYNIQFLNIQYDFCVYRIIRS